MTCSICGKEIDTRHEPFKNFNGEFFCWKCALERAVKIIAELKGE